MSLQKIAVQKRINFASSFAKYSFNEDSQYTVHGPIKLCDILNIQSKIPMHPPTPSFTLFLPDFCVEV